MNEWIEWKGGDRPVGWHTKVDYKLVGIDKVFSDIAGHLRWGDAEGAEIVLYRPSKQQSMEEAYDETHKEIGDSDEIRSFDTGATRGADRSKLDYEGFLSPLVLERFAVYMHQHRTQADGKRRESDNWQKGMPQNSYMKSGWRHFMDWWKEHRGIRTKEGLENALCAVIFNAQGYLHEHLKKKEGK